jgi:ABC-type branched-subunit amino acid transport system substrate-binding protein
MRSVGLLAALVLALGASACGGDRDPVRIGVLADCRGLFAALSAPQLASAELPLLARGGTLAGDRPEQGVRGARVAGRPVEIVPGCTEVLEYSVLVEEARRLVELEHVDVVVGPFGDGDALVLRDVARRYPDVTFVVATAAPPELTLHDPAPNLFRFSADGATSVAGLGAYAYRDLGWRSASLVVDESAGGWANADAFTAEFCALGGTIAERVSAPLVGPDGAVAAHVSPDADGVAMMLSPFNDAAANVLAAADQAGDAPTRVLLGPGAVLDASVVAALPAAVDGIVAATALPPVADTPAMAAHVERFGQAFPGLPRELALGPIILPFYDATEAVLQALEAAGGDPGHDGARLREELARVQTTFPDGPARLDANRQGIRDVTLARIAHEGGQGVLRTVRTIHDAEQGFGGILTAAPAPSSAGLPCRRATPPPWAAAP